MSKRNISRQQAWRARKIQEDRIKRATRKAGEDNQPPDSLGPEQQGKIIAVHGVQYVVEDLHGEHFSCLSRQNLGAIVVGDQIIWQAIDETSGIVTAVLPRKSVLERPNFHGNTKPVAANIDQIVIVCSPVPELQTTLIDRYLVAVEISHLTPMIVLNKIDLLDAQNLDEMQMLLSTYVAIGYQVLYVATNTNKSIKILQENLQGKTSILVGQSGVGKSSTIKALLPEIDIQIGEISNLSQLGKHTTSASRLYNLPFGGSIIDSPGVRDFGLWHVPKENIAWGFREFRPYLSTCKFKNCTHRNEPGCSIIQAVNDNVISSFRWKNYCTIFELLTQ